MESAGLLSSWCACDSTRREQQLNSLYREKQQQKSADSKVNKSSKIIVKVPRVNASVFFYHSYRKQKKKWDDLGNKNKITFREKLFQEFPILHQFLHVGFSPQTVQQCKNTNKAAHVALCLQQPAKKAEPLLCSTLQSFGSKHTVASENGTNRALCDITESSGREGGGNWNLDFSSLKINCMY